MCGRTSGGVKMTIYYFTSLSQGKAKKVDDVWAMEYNSYDKKLKLHIWTGPNKTKSKRVKIKDVVIVQGME